MATFDPFESGAIALDELPKPSAFDPFKSGAIAEPSSAPPVEASYWTGFKAELGERVGQFAKGVAQIVPSTLRTISVLGQNTAGSDPYDVPVSEPARELNAAALKAYREAPPEDQPLYRFGDTIERSVNKAIPEPVAPDLWHSVNRGSGQMLPMLVGGAAAKAAGAGIRGAAALATSLGAVQEFDDAFGRARERGDDPDTAFAKSFGYASVAALIENKLGVGRLLRQYFPEPGAALAKITALGVTKKLLGNFVAGGLEEGSQRFTQNWIVDEKPSLEGVMDEALPGAIVQGIIGAPSAAVGVGERKRRLTELRDERKRRLTLAGEDRVEPIAREIQTPDDMRAEAVAASERVASAIADRTPIAGLDVRLAGARDRLPDMGYAYNEADDIFTPVRKVEPTIKSVQTDSKLIVEPPVVPTPLPVNGQPTETAAVEQLTTQQVVEQNAPLLPVPPVVVERQPLSPVLPPAAKVSDSDLRVSVQSPMTLGTKKLPGYVQIDSMVGGENQWSSNPEALRKQGYDIPTAEELQKLPQGQYTIVDAKLKLKALAEEKPGGEIPDAPKPATPKGPEKGLPESATESDLMADMTEAGRAAFKEAKAKPDEFTAVDVSNLSEADRRNLARIGLSIVVTRKFGQIVATYPARLRAEDLRKAVQAKQKPTPPAPAAPKPTARQRLTQQGGKARRLTLNPKPKSTKPLTPAQEFDKLILEHGPEAGWVTSDDVFDAMLESLSNTGTAVIKAKIGRSKSMQAARRMAANEMGIPVDAVTTPQGRAKMLGKLREHIEQKASFKEAAAYEPGSESIPVTPKDLTVGEVLTIGGEEVRVSAKNERTGEVTLEDGRRFGRQKVPGDAPIYADEAPTKQAAPLELDKPESVEEQKARLAREAAAKKAQDAKDKLAADAAAKLKGTTGDLGQGDLLAEPSDLFAPKKPQGQPSPTAIDTAITAIEDLQKKLRGSGADVSMGVPKAILDTALEAARLVLIATRSIAKAVDAAIAKIRELGHTEFDENEVRAELQKELTQEPVGDDGARHRDLLPDDELGLHIFESEGGKTLRDTSGDMTPESLAKITTQSEDGFDTLVAVAAILKELNGGSLSELSPQLKSLVKSLISKVDIPIKVDRYFRGYQGRFTEYGYKDSIPTISIYPRNQRGTPLTKSQFIGVLVHEAVHYLVTSRISNSPQSVKLELNRIFWASRELSESQGMSQAYGMTNESEFIAEAFSNPKFRKWLAQQPYGDKQAGIAASIRNLWEGFLNVVAKAIGLQPDQLTILDRVIQLSDQVAKNTPYKSPMAAHERFAEPVDDETKKQRTGATVIDPATGERVPDEEGGEQEVQVNSIVFTVRGTDRMTPEEKAIGVARAHDYFKTLGLPGEADKSKGTLSGAIDTNVVFTIKSDGELHDDLGEQLLAHLTDQIKQLHQPTGSPAYVVALVNAITKNFSYGNLKGVFSQAMTDRLLPVPVQIRSFAGSFLRALTGIPLTMANIARNADWHLRRMYEDMFGGDLVRKIMDRIALNFRERFTGEEIERLYNSNPILQELFLKVVSRLKVKPSLREVIEEIFATPINKQDDIVDRFVDRMVNKFSATPEEAAKLKREFSRTFEASFRSAREAAQAKALAALLPEERKTIGAGTPLWKKLTDLVNSGWFDSAKVVEEYARSKGMPIPTEAELERMRNWSIKEQSLREPTLAEIEASDEPTATAKASAVTLESRQDLLRKMNTQWSRWTHPLIRMRHFMSDVSDPVKRYNTAMAANEWLTANLLLKLGFGSRQILDVGTSMVLHTPKRAAVYAFEQWDNDKSAGRDANLLDSLSTSITDAYRTRLKVLGDTLASFKRTLAGKGEQKNVEQLLSSIAVFDRMLLQADEMKAAGKPVAARFLHLLALTLRFGRQFAAAADVIQGVPAEAQEMAHQIRVGLREQGKGKAQQELEFNTILGLLTTARVESLTEARKMLESRGLEVTNASIQRAAWHLLREKIYQAAKKVGLPADEWKAQNHYFRNVIGWNEPETQGFGGIGGPGGLVAMTAKAGKELTSKAGIPAFPFVFGNAMGIALNRKLAYTPLGLFPGIFKGSPWFEGERNIRERKIEAIIGTTIGSTLFTLAALGIWVVLPRRWPDDEKEKAKWTANGWQPGMVIIPVSDTYEQKIGTRVGALALFSPYLAAGGAMRDALNDQAKKQKVLDERASKLGLKAEQIEGLDASQWLGVMSAAAWSSATGGRTASGMLGSYTDFGNFSAKKTGAAATSSLIPGLPGFQELSRMGGSNINPKTASFWDLMVPLPTSDANRVNLLGDPMRNENDLERIFQVLSGGSALFPASSEQFKKNKAYANLFSSDYRPPAINPVRGYQFGNEFRPMTQPELQRYTTARGRNFSEALQAIDVNGMTPAQSKSAVQAAFEPANARALESVGATSPRASTRSQTISGGSAPRRIATPRASGRRAGLSGRLRISSGRRLSLGRRTRRLSLGSGRSRLRAPRIRLAAYRRPRQRRLRLA